MIRSETDPRLPSATAGRSLWIEPSARAVVCLALAGLALAVAWRELSGPSPEERAREAEDRAGAEVESLAEAAARLADSWAEERDRREAERAALLDSAVESSMALARKAEAAHLGAEGPAPEDSDLARLLPRGVAVAVIGADGSALLEAGGVVDFDSHATLVRAGPGGTTVAAAWAEELPDRKTAVGDPTAVGEALARTLAPVVGAGRGLYFVSPDGELALELAARPVPAAPLARSLPPTPGLCPGGLMPRRPKGRRWGVGDGRARPPARGTGDMETGRLIGARRFSAGLGWTAAAEVFLSPRELTAGGRAVAGAVVLTMLGLLAAAVFAHTVWGQLSGGRANGTRACVAGTRGRVGRVGRSRPRPGTRGAERAGAASALVGPPGVTETPRTSASSPSAEGSVEPPGGSVRAPTPRPGGSGGSILRLREALGTPADGPDLAASARSPILRALSRCVRAPRRIELPGGVAQWGAAVESETGGPGGGRVGLHAGGKSTNG